MVLAVEVVEMPLVVETNLVEQEHLVKVLQVLVEINTQVINLKAAEVEEQVKQENLVLHLAGFKAVAVVMV